ncbi:4-hydroxy-tetrahydrodipicolinate synthase [Ascidiimonas aurantiaca]|uniref:4-hydroxy-tetrahydrodipicolinate synthase n=1 Tax=Ascidiimonas aurantiaca TaxID=1685432 RepID=UPI0030EC4942
MNYKELEGTGVALVTPFTATHAVDADMLANVVNYVTEGGVDYLVVLGTTAETAALSNEERDLVKLTITTANKGRLPMVLGIGGNHTASVCEELQKTDLSPYAAVLSVSPYYNKPTQKGIYEHFKQVAQASSKPIILYNVPGRTASNIAPETVLQLASDFPNIIGIKEAAGDIVQAMRLLKEKPDDFLVISGDDMITLPMLLAGGAGVISVIGQGFPKEFSKMVRLGLHGESADAYSLHYRLMHIIDMIFEEGNPAGIKTVLSYLGMGTNNVRLPLVNASSDLQQRIKDFIVTF